jgi:hypothetical protein
MTTLLPVHEDYSNGKDFASLDARIDSLIESVWPTWSLKNKASGRNLLKSLNPWCLDFLSYYCDKQSREGRFAFAELRKNMVAICKLIDYALDPASEAGVDVTLTVLNPSTVSGHVRPNPPTATIIIGTADPVAPIRGEVQDVIDINVGGGVTSQIVSWRHAITQPMYIQASTNLPNQVVRLPFGPYIAESAVVSTLTPALTWTRVDNFLLSGPTSYHYREEIDHNDLCSIYFGDGINGSIPVGNVRTVYEKGGGVTGNVDAGKLTKIEGSFVDDLGHTVYLSATNPADAAGGFPREEVDGARVNAPASLRAMTRCVAREDFEIVATLASWVGRALMLTSNEYPSGIDENHGILFCLPKGGGTPSSTQLAEVMTLCTVTYPHTVTFQLAVQAVTYFDLDFVVWAWPKEGTTAVQMKANILADLDDFFEPMLASGAPNPGVGFGFEYKDEDGEPTGEIPLSDLMNVVRDATGVRKIGAGLTEFTVNGLHVDVEIPLYQFPARGTLTVIDGRTGTAI